MSDEPTMTREERLQAFAALSDAEQDIALTMQSLVKSSKVRRIEAAIELLSREELSSSVRSYLTTLMGTGGYTMPDIIAALEEDREATRLQSRARTEAQTKHNESWKRWAGRNPRGKWRTSAERDLAFFEPLLERDPEGSPEINAYVQLLRRQLRR